MTPPPTENIDRAPSEVERYEQREPPAYRFDADRREFVQVLGAGLVVAVAAAKARAQQGGRGRGGRGGGEGTVAPARRFHIGADGTITAFTSKVEVGQGSRTQITQAIAEELHVPLEHIQLVMADTELCPDDGGTAGSRTTPATVPSVRRSAAQARAILLTLAAARLGADSSALTLTNGTFTVANSDKRLTLAELAAGDAFNAEWTAAVPGEAAVTRVDEWRVLGTAVAKTSSREVVTGAHRYPSDIVLPGMLYGKVLRPRGYNAKLTMLDLSVAEKIEGVQVVRDGDFVGVVAPTTHAARKAIEALSETAEWDVPLQPSSDELFEHLKSTATTAGNGLPQPRERTWGEGFGSIENTPAGAKKYTGNYEIAYIQHAPMEPRAAVAEWTDGKLTVWTGSQQPSRVQGELTQAFRLLPERVRVIVPDTGGGFGGKHSGEAAVEAARLAKGAGKPVSLRWTREEECTWAYCRPAGLIEVAATLDDTGKLLAWDFTNYNSGESALDTPYQSPHGRTRFLASKSPLRQGSYRGLASTANTFARESAIDDLAQLAGVDPLDFRLNHLPDGRLKDVLVAAAERFKWREQPKYDSNEFGIGLACGTEKGSFVAACVRIRYREGKLQVTHICQAYECGAIQNPANLRSQVVGAIVQGLGGALWEHITFKEGRLTNPRFSEYRVPRMEDMPEIDVVLLDRKDLASIGAGETPIIAVAPAIANALFQAIGERRRTMPLVRES
jgi:CO/xanthine dehydrogenase Mo-binding subunit